MISNFFQDDFQFFQDVFQFFQDDFQLIQDDFQLIQVFGNTIKIVQAKGPLLDVVTKTSRLWSNRTI